MNIDAFFNLRRAEEERLKAERARSQSSRAGHLKLASIYQDRANQIIARC